MFLGFLYKYVMYLIVATIGVSCFFGTVIGIEVIYEMIQDSKARKGKEVACDEEAEEER